MLEVQEKRKDKKIRKRRSEKKVVGFSSESLFPTRKREAVTQGRTKGINHSKQNKHWARWMDRNMKQIISEIDRMCKKRRRN